MDDYLGSECALGGRRTSCATTNRFWDNGITPGSVQIIRAWRQEQKPGRRRPHKASAHPRRWRRKGPATTAFLAMNSEIPKVGMATTESEGQAQKATPFA